MIFCPKIFQPFKIAYKKSGSQVVRYNICQNISQLPSNSKEYNIQISIKDRISAPKSRELRRKFSVPDGNFYSELCAWKYTNSLFNSILLSLIHNHTIPKLVFVSSWPTAHCEPTHILPTSCHPTNYLPEGEPLTAYCHFVNYSNGQTFFAEPSVCVMHIV